MMQRRLVLTMFAAVLSGCVAYYPTPVPGVSAFDRSWEAALGAAADSGVSVTLADRGTGRIQGYRGGATVGINVLAQADGRVRVEIDSSASALADQLTAAYNRRMGR
jgi:hypothetical protein